MSEEAGYADDESPAQDYDEQPSERLFTQSQVDKIIQNRLPEFDEYRDKAQQFDSLTQSATEAAEESADWRGRYEAAEAELAWRDTLLQRQEIAAEKGLDPRMWSRIRGETREEIEADIGELQGFMPSGGNARRPAAFRSGASADGPMTAKERAAQALRGAREAR